MLTSGVYQDWWIDNARGFLYVFVDLHPWFQQIKLIIHRRSKCGKLNFTKFSIINYDAHDQWSKIKRLRIKNGFTSFLFSFSLASPSLAHSHMPSSHSHNHRCSVTPRRSRSHNGRSSSSSRPHRFSSQAQGQNSSHRCQLDNNPRSPSLDCDTPREDGTDESSSTWKQGFNELVDSLIVADKGKRRK
jgi:hypothetical protein